MRIAVTYEDGEVFQHFGHCAQFKLYDVDYNAVGKGNYEGSSESEQVSVDRMLDGVVMARLSSDITHYHIIPTNGIYHFPFLT